MSASFRVLVASALIALFPVSCGVVTAVLTNFSVDDTLEPVQGSPRGIFPIVVFYQLPGQTEWDAEPVYFRELGSFLKHLKGQQATYSYLVPPDQKAALQRKIEDLGCSGKWGVDINQCDVWEASFEAEDIAPGRQSFKVVYSQDDDYVNVGWYEATDKEFFAKQSKAAFGPGHVFLNIGNGFILTIVLYLLGFWLYIRLKPKTPGLTSPAEAGNDSGSMVEPEEIGITAAGMARIKAGYALALVILLLEVADFLTGGSFRWAIVGLWLFSFFYWMYSVTFMHGILKKATDGAYAIRPGRAGWFHLIPVFNAYWIFHWTAYAAYVIRQSGARRLVRPWLAGLVYLLSFFVMQFVSVSLGLVLLFWVAHDVFGRLRQVWPPESLPVKDFADRYPKRPEVHRGVWIVTWLVFLAAAGLTAAIMIPAVIETRIEINDDAAEGNLHRLSAAARFYREKQNPPAFPVSLAAIKQAGSFGSEWPTVTDPYQDMGYQFFYFYQGPDDFFIRAEPVDPGRTGSYEFLIDKDGNVKKNRIAG